MTITFTDESGSMVGRLDIRGRDESDFKRMEEGLSSLYMSGTLTSQDCERLQLKKMKDYIRKLHLNLDMDEDA